MYAVGVTEIDNMLMKLSVSSKMTEQERDTVIPFILKVCLSTRSAILSLRKPVFWIRIRIHMGKH